MDTQNQFVPVDLLPNTEHPDSFADKQFAPLDLRTGPSFADQLTEIAQEQPEGTAPEPEEVPPPVLPGEEPAPEPTPAPPPPVHEPEIIEFDDGSILTIEKTNRGWRAACDSGVQVENFYGKTKEEMWTNVAAAKMHATRHIRELNKKIKLTARPEPVAVAQTPQQPRFQPHQLTADEVYEIKNQLETNPDLALDSYFQKKTGLTVEQLASLANAGYQKGQQSQMELEMEASAKEFRANHPEYLQLDENYRAMVGWLAKYKLHRTLTDQNQNEIMSLLYHNGAWTAEGLEDAFEDLTQEGLLELAPAEEPESEEEPAPEPEPEPQPETPPAPNPRIARVRVGPRAGLGIRARETTSVTRDTARPPSAEELDNLSDAEIQTLFAGVRRAASQSARR